MIRRAWESKNFSKVVALLALFVALGGQAFGGSTLHVGDFPEAKKIATQKQLDALYQAMLESMKQDGGQLTSDMIKDSTLKSEDIKKNGIKSDDIKPNTITNKDIKNNTLVADLFKNHTLTGEQFKDKSLTAQQLQDKTIPESKIKPGTITSTALNEAKVTGVEKCTGGLLGPFGDVCTTPLKTAATWDDAEIGCDALGLRLPTITEGLRALSTFGAAQSIWTDEVYGAENTADGRVAMRRVQGDGIVLDPHVPGDLVQYRCVIKSSSST
jgi:hypothetical protein